MKGFPGNELDEPVKVSVHANAPSLAVALRQIQSDKTEQLEAYCLPLPPKEGFPR